MEVASRVGMPESADIVQKVKVAVDRLLHNFHGVRIKRHFIEQPGNLIAFLDPLAEAPDGELASRCFTVEEDSL